MITNSSFTAQPPPRSQPSRLKPPVDMVLFGTTLALIAFGLWMVFGTSFSRPEGAFFFLKRQVGGVFLGGLVMWGMMRTGYWKFKAAAVPLLLTFLVLLLLLWPLHVPGIAINENNSWRWIGRGSLRFQVSEFAKIVLMIFMAWRFSRSDLKIHRFKTGLLFPLIPAGIYCVLIEREPDLGTALVLFFSALTVVAVAGARKRHLAMIVGASALLVLLMTLSFGHRQSRMTTYLNPCATRNIGGDQVCNSLYAVGSGGMMGEGMGNGKQKYLLTQANTDFIFATIAEEFGFVRSFFVLFALAVVGWRGFTIASQTKDRFGALLATGIAALISWQALMNVAVATGSIPATGVPLPFISYGSSSLVVLMAGVGILLNIAQHPDGEPKSVARRR